MEFSRQEYWSGLPLPSPGDLPNPGIEPGSPALQTLYYLSFVFVKKNLEVISFEIVSFNTDAMILVKTLTLLAIYGIKHDYFV